MGKPRPVERFRFAKCRTFKKLLYLSLILLTVYTVPRLISESSSLVTFLDLSRHRIGDGEPKVIYDTCDTCKKPTVLRKVNTYWQKVGLEPPDAVVYSAFYDDRPILGDAAYVRVFGVGKLKKGLTYFCQLWYGNKGPFIVKAQMMKMGSGNTLPKYGKLDELMFTCPMNYRIPVPTHISLDTKHNRTANNLLPVIQPERKRSHSFGVCVNVAFGHVPRDVLIEWIELNYLFGVTEINVYNSNMSKESIQVLKYYEEKKRLHLREAPPPIDDQSYKAMKLASPTTLNDCMYRNIYKYNFIIVIDFDEIIFPRLHSDYSQMLQHIDSTTKRTTHAPSYTFHNTYYWVDMPPDRMEPTFLRTMQHTNRLKSNPINFAPKSMVNPRKCLSVFNHHCLIRFPRHLVGDVWTIDVDPEIATSNHYRTCPFDKAKCTKLNQTLHQDLSMQLYREQLLERVRQPRIDLGSVKPDEAQPDER